MVTAVELARRLGIAPKRFRDWLRSQARSGHPLLAGHVHYGRWEFSEDEAGQLEAEYRGGTSRDTASSSPPARKRDGPSPRRQVQELAKSDDPGHRATETWRGERIETLEDLLRPELRAVCVGINPSPVSVAAGHYYQGRVGKRFWGRLREVGLLDDSGLDFEDDAAFAAGVGFTDIVKLPSGRADEISAADYEHGRELLVKKLKRYQPYLIIFTFKKTATVLVGSFAGDGFAPALEVAGVPAFVMPGPYEERERADQALYELRTHLD